MKQRIFSLFFSFLPVFLVSEIYAQSGWTSISSPTRRILYAVSFADSLVGTAVGDSGTIIRTTDEGLNWVSQSSGTNKKLYGIHQIDAKIATVVGDSGIILVTSNGGIDWETHHSEASVIGAPNYLKAVQMFDSVHGIAVGHLSIHRTEDAWKTWITQTSPIPGLKSISFIDSLQGVAAGSGIIRTINGGVDWTTIWTGGDLNFSDIAMIDTLKMVAVGYYHHTGVIHRTNNGGTDWGSLYTISDDLNSVVFPDPNNGIIVGLSGEIFHSTTGPDWIMQPSGVVNDLYGVSFIDSTRGIVVGASGIILRTVTGGILPVKENPDIPNHFFLNQNYPNPFNPVTIINYQLPVNSVITIKIFNFLGEEIITLVNEWKEPGSYHVSWNASGMPSGIYFYRLTANAFVSQKKMILIK